MWLRQQIGARCVGAAKGTKCDGTASGTVGDQYQNPTDWAGSTLLDYDSGAAPKSCSNPPQSNYRGTYPVGGSLTLLRTKATKISVAASLPGITVGATSGYSTSVQLSWQSKRGTGIYLCGTTGDEAGSSGVGPGVVYAQNR
jgi:hypothetical protein